MTTSTTKHTAGPWGRNIPPVSKYPIIYAGRNTHVAQVITRGLPEAEAEANARLIAAAPELLSAIVELLDACPTSCEDRRLNEAMKGAEKAIAKARGKS